VARCCGGTGYDDVGMSFVSLAEPSVPAARSGRRWARRGCVVPYFLFAGYPDRSRPGGRVRGRHPGIDVRVAG